LNGVPVILIIMPMCLIAYTQFEYGSANIVWAQAANQKASCQAVIKRVLIVFYILRALGYQ